MSKVDTYDPNKPGTTCGTIFGLPHSEANAELIIVPVPWDVTTSYRPGSRLGPQAIYQASLQVDLYEPLNPGAWKRGIFLASIDEKILSQSETLRKKVEPYLEFLTSGGELKTDKALLKVVDEVNTHCQTLNSWVKERTAHLLDEGKRVALLGGDHSTPFGFMQALAEKNSDFGILQIDAHADLRDAYEGFRYSHASIMHNALTIPQISKLIQVGVRDYCDQELSLIKDSNGRVVTFFDADLQTAQFEGQTWKEICKRIVSALPDQVYISFDIDGLDPRYCPNTGTPVPGGLSFDQAVYLIQSVIVSGRRIIGFDLNEVSPNENEWDANVGARMLYKLCNLFLLSN